MLRIRTFIILAMLLLSACMAGPNYVRPKVVVPTKYKEVPKGWKIAEPKDTCTLGAWWKVFNDPVLNSLEKKVNISNQNIAVAWAQYRQAGALVDEAVAGFFPMISGIASITRQKNSVSSSSSSSSNTTTITGLSTSSGKNIFSTNTTLGLNASWEIDLWGAIRRAVEASQAGFQASSAQLAATRLSMQGSLAQFYFQLRNLDVDQKLLDDTVTEYKKSLQLTKNRYAAGVAARLDVIQAETQLQTAETLAIDNGISRGQIEHAIAVLTGQPPSCFSIKPTGTMVPPPQIPIQVPSELLERRPDIGQAERLAAQANAQIGVAVAAYFPTLTLTGSVGFAGTNFSHLISGPAEFWSVGAQLAQFIFDGGLRDATVDAARATFDQTIATYRQTVLAAFQDVEDNLVALRLLKSEIKVQTSAVANAALALKITLNQYKAGTVDYSEVIIAQNTSFAAQKILIDLKGRQMVASVGLIKALGGGWDHCPPFYNQGKL